jgi:hypothetical protein
MPSNWIGELTRTAVSDFRSPLPEAAEGCWLSATEFEASMTAATQTDRSSKVHVGFIVVDSSKASLLPIDRTPGKEYPKGL